MDTATIIFFILFSGISVSYGWGMRGTIIGGEKGAMLPGAFFGFLAAIFSDSEVLSSSPLILAGVGATAMYCGGCMTYGETLHLSMHEANSPTLKKGLVALFVKGGIWFGLFGGLISMFISAIAGLYELWQIILFFGLLPVFALSFYFLCNKPHNPEENRFPKIYFSTKRQEAWGGLLGILSEIIIFALIFKDFSCIMMTVGSFLSGAVGWVIAQIMQIKAKHPAKNGKRLFEKLNRKNGVETWKLMECTLGAIGGIGCAATFIISKPLFAEKFAIIDKNGLHSYISESKVVFLLLILYLIILSVDMIQFFIIPKDRRSYKKYIKLCTDSEFAIYCIIPLFLIMLGAHRIAILIAVPVIMLVLAQEFAEKFNKTGHTNPFVKIPLFIPALAAFIFTFINKSQFSNTVTMLIFSAVYEAAFFGMKKLETGNTNLSTGEKAVHGYFIICCALIMIMSIFIQ